MKVLIVRSFASVVDFRDQKYNHQDQINTTLFMNTNNKFLYDNRNL